MNYWLSRWMKGYLSIAGKPANLLRHYLFSLSIKSLLMAWQQINPCRLAWDWWNYWDDAA